MSKRVSGEFERKLSWDEKAQENPLYAVMAVEQFAEKSPDPDDWTEEDLQLFFAKGQFMWDVFLRPVVERMRLQPGKAFVVEYGSGAGRILKAVKEAGFDCAGIDISQTMLDHSRRLVPSITRLEALGEDGRCGLPTGSADFVYSYAVVQHISQLSKVREAVAEMCRLLKPGAVLKVQFRSLGSQFRPSRDGQRTWVHNFESSSLVLDFAKRSLRGLMPRWIPALPRLWRTRHTNWVGVPLSRRKMESLLRAGGVRLIGLEEDVGHEGMVWALGRKTASGEGRQ